MAKQPTLMKQPLSQRLREYYVYDPKVQKIGPSHQVVDKGEKRVVLMTPQQAQYWLEQLAIGEKPFSELSSEHKEIMHQVTAGRVHKDGPQPEQEQPEVEPNQTPTGQPIVREEPLRSMVKQRKEFRDEK